MKLNHRQRVALAALLRLPATRTRLLGLGLLDEEVEDLRDEADKAAVLSAPPLAEILPFENAGRGIAALIPGFKRESQS